MSLLTEVVAGAGEASGFVAIPRADLRVLKPHVDGEGSEHEDSKEAPQRS